MKASTYESVDSEEAKNDIQSSLPRKKRTYQEIVLVKDCETKTSTHSENTESSKRFQLEQENDAEPDMLEKNFESLNESHMDVSTVCDYANYDHVDNNTDETNASTELNDECYDLNKNDLRNLSMPEITSRTVEEIQNINRIKLKEEMAPTIRTVNGEHDHEGKRTVAETGTLKYLKAIGKIKLLQEYVARGSINKLQ